MITPLSSSGLIVLLFFFVGITNHCTIHSQSSDDLLPSNSVPGSLVPSSAKDNTIKSFIDKRNEKKEIFPSSSSSSFSSPLSLTVPSSSSSSSYSTSLYSRRTDPSSSSASFTTLSSSSSLLTRLSRSLLLRPIAATPDARAEEDGCWSVPSKTACKYLPPNGDTVIHYYGPDHSFIMHPLLVPVFSRNFTIRINVTAIQVPNIDDINGLAIVKVSLGGIDRRDGTGNIHFPTGCTYSSPIPVMDFASGSSTLPPKPYLLYDLTIDSMNGQHGCWFGSRYEYLIKITIEGFAASAATVAATNFRYTIQTWIDGYVTDVNDSNRTGYNPLVTPSSTPSPYWWDITPSPSPDYNSFYGNDPDNNAWWLTADISSPTPSSSSSPTLPVANIVPPNILPITSFLSLSSTDTFAGTLYPGQSHLYYVWSRLSTNNNPTAYSSISSADPDIFSIAMDNYVGYTLYLESNNTDAVSSHILTIRSGYIDATSPYSQWGECTAIAHNLPLDSSSNYASYLTLDVTYDNGCYYGAPSVYYIRISYDETLSFVTNVQEPLLYRLSGSVMNPSATSTPTPSITPSNTPTPSTTQTLTSTSTSTHTATVTPSVTPTGSTTMIFRSILLPSSSKNTNLNITDNGLPDIFKNGGLIINRDNSPTPSPQYGPSDLLDPPYGSYGEGFPDPVTNTRSKDTSIVVRNTVDYDQPKYYRMTTTRDMGINLVWLAGISPTDNQPVLIEAALYGPPSSLNANLSAYQWLPQFSGKFDDPINVTDIENTNYTLPMIEKYGKNVTMGMSGTLTITRCELAFALGYPCDERFSGLYRTLWFRIRVLRPRSGNRRQLANGTLVAPPPVNLPGATGVPFSFAMDWNYNDGEGSTGISPTGANSSIDLAMLIPTIIGVLLVVSVGIYIFVIGPVQVREIRKQRMQSIKSFLHYPSKSSSSSGVMTDSKGSQSVLRSPPSKAHLSAVPSISMYGKPMLDSKMLMTSDTDSTKTPEILVTTGTVSKEVLHDILIKPTIDNDAADKNTIYHHPPLPSKVTNEEWRQYGEEIIDISDNFEPATVISLSEQQQLLKQQHERNAYPPYPLQKHSTVSNADSSMDGTNPLSSFDAELIATIHEVGEENDDDIDFDTEEKLSTGNGKNGTDTSVTDHKDIEIMMDSETTPVTIPVTSSNEKTKKRSKRVQYTSDGEENGMDSSNQENNNEHTTESLDGGNETNGNENESSSSLSSSADDMFTRILHKQHPSMYVPKKKPNPDANDDHSSDKNNTPNKPSSSSESVVSGDNLINDSSSISSSSFSATTDDAASLLISRMEQELQKTGTAVTAASVGLGSLTSQGSYYSLLPSPSSLSSSSVPTAVSLPRRTVPPRTTMNKVPRTTGIIIPPIIPLQDGSIHETVQGPKVSTTDEVFANHQDNNEPQQRRDSETSLTYDDILDDIQLAYPRSEYGSFAESELTSASGYNERYRRTIDEGTLAELDSGKIPSLEEMRQQQRQQILQQQQDQQRRGVSFSSSGSWNSSSAASAFTVPGTRVTTTTNTYTNNDTVNDASSNVANSPPDRRNGSIISSSNHHRHLIKVLVSRTTDRSLHPNPTHGSIVNGSTRDNSNTSSSTVYESNVPVLSFTMDKHGRGEVPRPPGLPAEFKPTPMVVPSSPSRSTSTKDGR